MKTWQIILKRNQALEAQLVSLKAFQADLILLFGAIPFFESDQLFNALREIAPNAIVTGCSTAGEIADIYVYDNTCIINAIRFDHTPLVLQSILLKDMDDSYDAGARLARALPADDLKAVFLLGPGVNVNGSALVLGMQDNLAKTVALSGGLAADAGAFKQTWTMGPNGARDDQIVALGLYGEHIRFSYGSFAGWWPFGPVRKVTHAKGNILYELDGQPALDLYKTYLGEYAKDLPASGLLFPFEMLGAEQQQSGVFRTIMAVSEADGAITLAGEIDPQGYLRLMHASTEKLIEGAEQAAQQAYDAGLKTDGEGLAILVSCVGRRLVMGDRVDEEVEVVAEILGKSTKVSGFYSNGEIANTGFSGNCQLNNQTMTITWIGEVS
ncbi:FIST signal transduction protein [Ampullimonas aquatilis]|uniref:FIST signal transduction protein n=1 Tax=Ampullimonas aquatilis TaxID=1341549 RepID=UPI003C739955